MDPATKNRLLDAMMKHIKQTGMDEVAKINHQQNEEFESQRKNYLEEEKAKIEENSKNELANEEVRLKIEKSK